jgi:16S rRNA processing protein RimM
MDFVSVGKILTSYGVKGEAKIFVITDFVDQRFAIGNKLILEDLEQTLTVESYRMHQGFLLVKFVEINTPEEIKLLHGRNLLISKESRKEVKGNFYYTDLVGCTVYDSIKTLGVITKIERYPTSDILFLDSNILIPFVDAWIIEVDLKNRKIKIRDYVEY